MATDPLMERLQRAVAPDYRVERELSGGGQGRVYLAHEILLNREVAIKVLRPELATAAGAEAFLREARILAGVRHQNIVVIYRPGEGEGLQYYIMELVNGPTLEERLAAGPLSTDEAVQLGIELLDGLETVHRAGIVHRDIKPSNVFLLARRALLSDFGIARPPTEPEGFGEGTPGYMAPEQEAGGSITSLTDIYSTGALLYEAITARRFPPLGEDVNWDGIPHRITRVLQRAVAFNPEQRWHDAGEFRRALERAHAPNTAVRVALFIAAGLLLGVLGMQGWRIVRPPVKSPGALEVAFDRIDYTGPTEHRGIADSLLDMVRSDLQGHPDFRIAPEPGFFGRRPASLVVQGRLAVAPPEARLQLTGGIPAAEFRIPFERWPTLRDSLDYHILLGVWDAKSPLAQSLPVQALPRSPEGLVSFLEAERLVADAQWQNAHRAYRLAEATDSTCLLCSWRITEIERWLGREPDPTRIRRTLAHLNDFPPWYRSLIRAGQLPLRVRFDTLRAVTERSRRFFLGWFQLGDELFHRGPLVGHGRAEAIPPLETAAGLEPGFGPAWEHLAWVATAEGDSTVAARALDSLDARGVASDQYSLVLRALLKLGFAWRFFPEPLALHLTQEALNDPTTQSSADLGAGPRLLPTFDAPQGAIALGRILETRPSRDLRRSGLTAQALGSLALGRLADTRAFTRRLTDVAPDAELKLFAAELQGALALLDENDGSVTEALLGLRPWMASGGTQQPFHQRAIWMSSMLGDRSGRRADAPHALMLLVAADSLAAAGQPRAALALIDTVDVDAVARHVDPFFRAVAHLRRAAWHAQRGDVERARTELLWYEHNDVIGLPTGLPQAAEIDWAFGTLARWRLAKLLDSEGRTETERGESCDAYAAVARQWAQAPAPYGARADSASTRVRELHCADRRWVQ